MEINKKYGPYALQLYLYLAKNANHYRLALSQQAAENEAGIKKTTFHKYVALLIAEGYLVKQSEGTYDFYETPQKQEKEDLAVPPCGKSGDPQDVQKNSFPGSLSSVYDLESPPFDKEIDKR